MVVRIERAAGSVIAAPRPGARRAPTRTQELPASPPISDEMPITTIPAMSTRRRPSRSAARPPSSMKPPYVSRYALGIHCRPCTEKCRSRRIEGSATLTIDASTKSRKATEASRASVSLPRRVARNDGWEAVAVMSGHRDVADRRARGARTRGSADAVQESWLRLNRSGADEVTNLAGWLTTVVARVSLDMLRARRSRHEDYVGSWLPEPVVSLDEESDPEQQALLADSVGLALLVVLDALSPAERLAFVLHDMFAMPFEEIAPIVDRTPAAARQLASRARRRVQGRRPEPDADMSEQRRLVDAFLAAARAGDFDALVAVLDPDVVFNLDTAGVPPRAREPVVGAEAVADQVVTSGYRRLASIARPATVNGAAGLVIAPGATPVAVIGFTTQNGRIVEIDLVADPAKLRGVEL